MTDTIKYGASTEEVARFAHVQPSTVREHYCRRGSYYGLIPRKLPNGRLDWPADYEARMLSIKDGEAA
ncbi:hypothetical protein [Thioalkalivibrio thiocyanodenitrificans]|uniref:hypothetical protein n=1 Tax=Thioalkalivibrio thiocyanodenitrificans TaxID=243063 RepID=UPI00036CD19E|nr:hypothetical protein [Thioalkalivibrio thiocyanodenitrificans]